MIFNEFKAAAAAEENASSSKPTRLVEDHLVMDDEALKIEVLDAPGHGNAHHLYEISGWNHRTNPSQDELKQYAAAYDAISIMFQNGPIKEVGVNGVTHEVLLAVIIDRLRSFQRGEYACKENACALTHLEEALHWLQQRTIKRMRRGVEGTHAV
jgi:hypothetical protein